MLVYGRRQYRGVAQPGSAPEWGSGGRRFKSSHPDQKVEPLALMPVDNNIIESGELM